MFLFSWRQLQCYLRVVRWVSIKKWNGIFAAWSFSPFPTIESSTCFDSFDLPECPCALVFSHGHRSEPRDLYLAYRFETWGRNSYHGVATAATPQVSPETSAESQIWGSAILILEIICRNVVIWWAMRFFPEVTPRMNSKVTLNHKCIVFMIGGLHSLGTRIPLADSEELQILPQIGY